jgi:hypothetical protein
VGNKKKYFIEDLETNTLIPCSKETKELHDKIMLKLWKDAFPILKNIKSKIIIMGTGGDIDNFEFENVFYGK